MEKFVPREKMSRKARHALDAKKRVLWTICPATKRIENKKRADAAKPRRCDLTDD